jgi:nitroreductase
VIEWRFMNVTEALNRRKSIRNFLPTPVPNDTIRTLLESASRAPSGGNVQPWRIYVLNGTRMEEFASYLATRSPEGPGYDVYPAGLTEPYRTSRYEVGEAMYALLGIAREDKAARYAHLARNFTFFDAPAAIFCFVDRIMGPPQWSDLGMFLQSFMLLATEAGLDTCPQEAWTGWSAAVSEFVGAPSNEMLFCGVALGHGNPDAPVNQLVSTRRPLEEWARFV